MAENYKDLQALIECLNIDVDKFNEKKVKAAGQRARNNLLNCKKLCDKLRKQIMVDLKDIPVKSRSVTSPSLRLEDAPATPLDCVQVGLRQSLPPPPATKV